MGLSDCGDDAVEPACCPGLYGISGRGGGSAAAYGIFALQSAERRVKRGDYISDLQAGCHDTSQAASGGDIGISGYVTSGAMHLPHGAGTGGGGNVKINFAGKVHKILTE